MESSKDVQDSKREKLYSRISFWLSLILATLAMVWYYERNPPDTEEVKKMRIFFKENIMEVTQFIKLNHEEMDVAAAMHKHPFYKTFVKASQTEQDRIRALIHISVDYNSNSYWFNLIFAWTVVFTTLWFLGAITEGIIVLVRQGKNVKPPA
ncbi:MAG: hypothetical protein ACQ9MH_00220 [Nitrospinales bacterium]